MRQCAQETNPVAQLLDEAWGEAPTEVRTQLLRDGGLDHHRLGVTITEMEAFLDDIIWPSAYTRDDETYDGDLLWVSQQYGELVPGHGEELCYDLIAWIRQVQQMPHVLGGHRECEGLYFRVGTQCGKPRYESKSGAVIHFDLHEESWVMHNRNKDVCFRSGSQPVGSGHPKHGPPSYGWCPSCSTANSPVDAPQVFYDYVDFSAAELIIAKRQRDRKQDRQGHPSTSAPILMGGSGVGPATDFLSHVQAEHFDKTKQAMHLLSNAEFPVPWVCLAIIGGLMFVFCVLVQTDKDFWLKDPIDHKLISLLMAGFFMLTPVAITKVRTWNTGDTDKHRIWSDVMCLRQCQKDFDLGRVAETIKSIGSTTMFLDPLPGSTSPALITRIFCIFEIFSTMQYDEKNLHAVVSPGGYFSTMPTDIERVSIAYAESRNQHEKDAIMDRIANWAHWHEDKEGKVAKTQASMRHLGVACVNSMLKNILGQAFYRAETRFLRQNVWAIFFIKTLVFVLSLYLELREAGKLGWSGVHHLQHMTPRPVCVAVLEHEVESYYEFFWTKFEHVRPPLISVTATSVYCACLIHCLVEIKTPRHGMGVREAMKHMWLRCVRGTWTSQYFIFFMLFHEACICTLYLCMHKKECIKYRPIVMVCNSLIFLFPHCCVYRVVRHVMLQLPGSLMPSQTSVLHIGRFIVRKRDVLIATTIDVFIMMFYFLCGADVLEASILFSFILMFCCFFVIESTHVRSPPPPPTTNGNLHFWDEEGEPKSWSYGTFDQKTLTT